MKGNNEVFNKLNEYKKELGKGHVQSLNKIKLQKERIVVRFFNK